MMIRFTDEEKRMIVAATPIWIAWVVAIVMAVGMVWSDCEHKTDVKAIECNAEN
jgi:uncharacterized YccA/Bax inhibitor family protein